MVTKKIGIVGCVKTKQAFACAAGELYTSTLFTSSVEWLKNQGITEWYILSAEHGLLHPSTVIAPYEKTLSKMNRWDYGEWCTNLGKQVRKTFSEDQEFVVLGGALYSGPMTYFKSAFPLKGMGLGQRLQFLKNGAKVARVLVQRFFDFVGV